MTNKKSCDSCNESVPVKKDGDLWKHNTPDGVPCVPGTDHTTQAAPLAFTADVEQKKDEVRIDVADAGSKKTPPEKRADDWGFPNVFLFTFSVSEPCPYLGEPKWEAENKKVAWMKAKDAGKQPCGEPRFLKSEVENNRRVLYYEVPIN